MGIVSDAAVLKIFDNHLNNLHKLHQGPSFTLVESFGGPLSPMVSMTPQADAWRSFRFPAVLVADPKLGGISTTIAALESLQLRGYHISSIVTFANEEHENVSAIQSYLRNSPAQSRIPVLVYSAWPNKHPDPDQDSRNVLRWFDRNTHKSNQLFHQQLRRQIMFDTNVRNATGALVWHPFMQHRERKPDGIMFIDSAHEDMFKIWDDADPRPEQSRETDPNGPPILKYVSQTRLASVFDGSASWWTQGLGHGNPSLALATAQAAGRYGHVMFAGATHLPAVKLARAMVTKLNDARSTKLMRKVFFTDNGSTGMEVAVKMGIKAATQRYAWSESGNEVEIIGLLGAYHGDTMGVMDCSEPSTYNKKVAWYRGRGFWFDFPKFSMKRGKWVVEVPEAMQAHSESDGTEQTFPDLASIFSPDRDASQYEKYIRTTLQREIKVNKRKFGSLIIEPVILGAGGMLFADPAFQRALVEVVRTLDFSTGEQIEAADVNRYPAFRRDYSDETSTETTSTERSVAPWSGLPVIFDEVFTGMYRLGQFSSASYLRVSPDISVHAKLLTGGVLPLCLTVASEEIFGAFLGPEKSDALLHGHSYTAHPVGCHVANVTLVAMERLFESDNQGVAQFRRSWGVEGFESGSKNPRTSGSIARENPISRPGRHVRSSGGHSLNPWSIWQKDFVTRLSEFPEIERVNALGSVLVFAIRDNEDAGYNSKAAISLRDKLLAPSPLDPSAIRIHSRVLGNVLYLMGSLTTPLATVQQIQNRLLMEFTQTLPEPTSAANDLEIEVARVMQGPMVLGVSKPDVAKAQAKGGRPPSHFDTPDAKRPRSPRKA